MKATKRIITLGFVVLTQMFVACSCRKQYGNFTFSDIKHHENTFLVDGYYLISMFEYFPKTQKLKLVRKWNTNGHYTGSGAIYYPKDDVVFSPYHFKNEQKGGVTRGNPAYQGMLVLSADGSQKAIEFSQADGLNGSEYVYPYGQNRLLISHSIFRKEPIDPNLGYLDSAAEYTYSDNIMGVALGLSINKPSAQQPVAKHLFMYSSIFDMDQQQIVKKLTLSLDEKSQIIGDYLYCGVGRSLIKVDLLTGKRTLLFQPRWYPEVNKPRNLNYLPRGEEDYGMPSGYCFWNEDNCYMIVDDNPYNVCDKTYQLGVRPPNARLVGGWEPSSIYRLDQTRDCFVKQYNFPTQDHGYIISPNQCDIILFERRGGCVFSYNTQTKAMHQYRFNTQGYSVFRVTYNSDYYFVLMEREPHSGYLKNDVAVAVIPRSLQGQAPLFKLEDYPTSIPSAEYSVISTPYFVSNGAYKCFRTDLAPAPTNNKKRR